MSFIRLNIRILPEDIAEGVKGDCTACPGALATLRALRELGLPLWRPTGDDDRKDAVIFGPTAVFVRLAGEDMALEGQTPVVAADFIRAFDNRDGGYEPPEPVSFTVDLHRYPSL